MKKSFTGVFTEEEFETILQEVVIDGDNSVKFATLSLVAERLVRPKVAQWCRSGGLLKPQHEDDLMQEIHMRLMKNVVVRFVLPSKPTEGMLRNADGFRLWLFSEAKYEKMNFLKKLYKHARNTIGWEEAFPFGEDGRRYLERVEKNAEESDLPLLKKVFHIAVGLRSRPYKILCWLAIFLCIAGGRTKIEANDIVDAAFSETTLYEMNRRVFAIAARIRWLEVTDTDEKMLMDALSRSEEDGVCYGERFLKEFYMKKGAKSSLSDWFHRINEQIQKKLGKGEE